jgi:hypothetical protein
MAATLRAAILTYKSGLVPSDLTSVELKQQFVGGSSKDKMCPIALQWGAQHWALKPYSTLKRGSERSPHVHTTPLWTTGIKLYDGFQEVLINTALLVGKIL